MSNLYGDIDCLLCASNERDINKISALKSSSGSGSGERQGNKEARREGRERERENEMVRKKKRGKKGVMKWARSSRGKEKDILK